MNIKFLTVLKPPPAIYHDFSTRKKFWEEKFTLVNMTSCGRLNVRKHREINNGEQYIILDIYSNIYCLYKRAFTSSESKDNIGIPGKGRATSMYLRTKIPNKKQKSRFAITDITKQYFRKLLKKFDNSPYLGYKSKQAHN